MLKISKIFLSILLVIFFNACSDEPNSIGIDQLEDDYLIIQEQIVDSVTFSNSVFDTLNTGLSSYLFVGNYDQAEAVSLVQFAVLLQDSIKEMLTSGSLTILSANIEMAPIYKLGEDYLTQIEGNEILKSWGTFNFTEDSLNGISDNINIIESISVSDTLFELNLNNNIAENWLRSQVNDLNNNYGILLKSSQLNKISGFQSLDGSTDFSSSGLMNLKVQLQKNDGTEFTLNFAPLQDVYVIRLNDKSFLETDEYFYVEGGVGINGELKFDFSSLPDDIVINEAVIELTLDSTKSFSGNANSNIVISAVDKDKNIDESALLSKADNKYRGSIIRLVQKLKESKSDVPLSLQFENSINTADRVAFYGKEILNSELKPKIIVRFSKFDL